MFSTRFQRAVVITRHARVRMEERGIDEACLLDVIDQAKRVIGMRPISGFSRISTNDPTICYARFWY